MGKIFVIMGPSCSGKDTLFNEVNNYYNGKLKPIVLYTTRPMREGEIEGKTYYFIDDKTLNEMKENNEIIESRSYNTVAGIWTYATTSRSIDLENNDYLTINTLEGFKSLKEYYGEDVIVPLYIQVDEDVRLRRAINREKKQIREKLKKQGIEPPKESNKEKYTIDESDPKIQEMRRRIEADSIDFSIEKRIEAGIPISNVFENNADPADIGTWVPLIALEMVRDQIVEVIEQELKKDLYKKLVYKIDNKKKIV